MNNPTTPSFPMKLSFSIPCASEFVSILRLAVSGIASKMDFPVEDIEDIKIALSEACTNSIQHAYDTENLAQEQTIDITAFVHKDKLELIVEDTGKGFDISKLGSPEQKENSEKKLGLGLGLAFIKNLMDDSEVVSTIGKGTKVRMTKTAPPSFSCKNA